MKYLYSALLAPVMRGPALADAKQANAEPAKKQFAMQRLPQ